MKKKKISKRISSAKKKSKKKPLKKVRARKIIRKKKVKRSEDEFPGYPHYPSNKDIMNPKNKMMREELTEASRKFANRKSKKTMKQPMNELMERPAIVLEEENIETPANTESDVTTEERQFLESDELSEDLGEDQELRTRVWPVDMAGDDLDVPGTETDNEAEEDGAEDEENNIYSIGGDRHEGLEEENDRGK